MAGTVPAPPRRFADPCHRKLLARMMARPQPAADQLAGLTPTIFEHVNALGTYTFNTDRPAGQLRALRAA